ncbi:ATP-grasp domain-containing protein [Aquabacterium sp. A7-Y]|uniref:ATP-grasp domain-containing protein n=1 Tax=Aquabacterium sp. A7-Y TaxID=1349605 RepID=UPI00223E6073|nr:ATP-grasp domain-containing protein [Aquabacterium sp. A7-Y]MCW7539594.1 ATP-grasp domain-containing protein [Aquabacterium sp. A7-Y]
MAKPSLLLLVHQARSYVALIQPYLEALGLSCLVLSSRALDARDLETAARYCERLWQVDDDHLGVAHLDPVLAEARAEGYEIVAALASFEGLRLLMSQANQRIGATDAEPEAIRRAMDKLSCRNALFSAGLSRARARLIAPDSIAALRREPQRLFVKPRRGAGSFACFRLDNSFDATKLAALQEQMQRDRAFKAIFAGQFDFIAEDYLPGDEYSFEVLVLDGRSYVIGVHAKYLDDSGGTTLETSNSCPAPRLSDAEQLAGERYIDAVLAALGLAEGCYHIETRYHPESEHWDVIEVNARMGGALINQSIGVFTGGLSMLQLWVKTVCSRTRLERDAMHALLASLRESTRRRDGSLVQGTVFLSRYGERNRVLERISLEAVPRPPDIYDIPVREGSRLPDSERGIFLLNALWKVDIADIAEELVALPAMLDASLIVRYAESD